MTETHRATDPVAGSPTGGLEPGRDRAVVMGVVNVTPDSFSDGGRFIEPAAAIARGLRLSADGADIIDVGGESTRPGAERVPAHIEARRVVPVVTELARAGIACSIDTTRAAVAAAALEAGAVIVNDVSGGLADPEMAAVVADAGVPWILMHWRGHSADMDELATYGDVVADVGAELRARVEAALRAGVDAARLILDPGLGFAKTAEHNWALLRALPELTGVSGPGWGFPVLIGASRKRFLGSLLADGSGPRPADGREAATAAISALAAAGGVWGVRVHEVVASLDAVRVAAELSGAGPRSVRAGIPGLRRGTREKIAGARSRDASAGGGSSDRGAVDRITLTGLKVLGRHGVFEHEKRAGQDFVVDIVLRVDLTAAAATDDLTRTVHYGELAELASGIVAGPPRDLIETVAGEIADRVLATFPAHEVEVTVHKPDAPIGQSFQDVSVTIRRSATGGPAATERHVDRQES